MADGETDMLVVDSRADSDPGHIWLSASARHVVEIARYPVLIVPRGVALSFSGVAAALSA